MYRIVRGLFYMDPAERDPAGGNYDHVRKDRLLQLAPREERVLDWLLDFRAKHGEAPSHQIAYDYFERANAPDETALIEEAMANTFRSGGTFRETFEEVVEHQGVLSMRAAMKEALEIAVDGRADPRTGELVRGVEPAVGHVRSVLRAPPARGEPTDPVVRDRLRVVADAARPDYMRAPARQEVYFGMFEPGQVHQLAAVSNAGKSSLALWLAGHWACGALPARDREAFALAVATEEDDPAAALRKVVPPDRDRALAVYASPEMAAEDLARLADRLRDLGRDHLGCDPGEFARRRFYALCRDPRDLGRFEAYRLAGPRDAGRPMGSLGCGRLAELVEALKREACPADPEEAVALVVVDTLARLGPRDGRELDNSALTFQVEQLEYAAGRARAALLALGHASQADHATGFERINPLTFMRGGTGGAAASRCALAMGRPGWGGGRVLGIHRASNNLPPRDPIYLETCPPGERGIHYARPLRPAEARRMSEEAGAAAERERLARRPSAEAAYRRLWAEGGAGPHTTADAKRAAAALWPSERGDGRPRSPDSAAVRELAGEFLAAWERDGDLEWCGTQRGARSTRNFRLLRQPPAERAGRGEAAEALDG